MDKAKMTFTKRIMTFVLIISVIDMQLCYILAFIGKDNIAETLSVAIVTEIIGVTLGYFAKSFFETKEEEKNKLLKELDAEREEVEE